MKSLAETVLEMKPEQRAELRENTEQQIKTLQREKLRTGLKANLQARMLHPTDTPRRRFLRGTRFGEIDKKLKKAREISRLAGLDDKTLQSIVMHEQQEKARMPDRPAGNDYSEKLDFMLSKLGMTADEAARRYSCSTATSDLFDYVHATYYDQLPPDEDRGRGFP